MSEEIKCKYCKGEMKHFVGNFIFCPNEDCPHRLLQSNCRDGVKTREYCRLK